MTVQTNFDARMLHADVNECVQEIHGCSQKCHNTLGNYTCSCQPGFILNADNTTCDFIGGQYTYHPKVSSILLVAIIKIV